MSESKGIAIINKNVGKWEKLMLDIGSNNEMICVCVSYQVRIWTLCENGRNE